MQRFLAASAILIIVASASGLAQNPVPLNEPPVIVTQGVGVLRLQADVAWVSITVDARAGKAVEARNRAASQMTAVQTAIRAVGLPAGAIKTSSFSLEPQVEEEYGAKVRVREYAVRNEIEVRVDNLDMLTEVLDAAGSVKTSDTLSVSIAGLRFGLRSSISTEQDALRMAVEDAMARAKAMASGAGRTLGEIVRIEEEPIPDNPGASKQIKITTRSGTNSPQFAPPVRIDTPVEPNQIEFRALVTLKVGIR